MTATSNEAVNGAQLFAVDAKTNANTAEITNINNKIKNITIGGDAYVSQTQPPATSRLANHER